MRSVVSERNQAGTIASKLSAALHSHHVNLELELPTSSPLVKRASKVLARSHVVTGTPNTIRRPISWDALLGEKGLTLS